MKLSMRKILSEADKFHTDPKTGKQIPIYSTKSVPPKKLICQKFKQAIDELANEIDPNGTGSAMDDYNDSVSNAIQASYSSPLSSAVDFSEEIAKQPNVDVHDLMDKSAGGDVEDIKKIVEFVKNDSRWPSVKKNKKAFEDFLRIL